MNFLFVEWAHISLCGIWKKKLHALSNKVSSTISASCQHVTSIFQAFSCFFYNSEHFVFFILLNTKGLVYCKDQQWIVANIREKKIKNKTKQKNRKARTRELSFLLLPSLSNHTAFKEPCVLGFSFPSAISAPSLLPFCGVVTSLTPL